MSVSVTHSSELETEKEWLTDSKTEAGELTESDPKSVRVLSKATLSAGSKPKLARFDRKLWAVDKAMDRLAWWPGTPTTTDKLIQAREKRRKQMCLVMSVRKHDPSYTTLFQDKRSLRYAHTLRFSCILQLILSGSKVGVI